MTRVAQFASQATPPQPRPHVVMRECGVCQSMIDVAEQTTTCSECGLTFHTECWEGNWGCCSYGCGQCNILKPPGADDGKEKPAEIVIEKEVFPWDFVILLVAAVAMLPSAFTFGAPSALVLIGTGARLFTPGKKRFAALAGAAAVCILGIAGGIGVSSYWWLGHQVGG